MKRLLLWSFPVALVVAAGVFASTINDVNAQDPDPPIITHYGNVSVRQYGETVTLSTYVAANENTTVVLNYGTESGNYTATAESADPALTHTLVFEGISYETLYYFQAVVTDEGGNAATSDEFTYQVGERGMRLVSYALVDTGPNGALLYAKSNYGGYSEAHYGSVSGTRPNVSSGWGFYDSIGGSDEHYMSLTNLTADTTYYYDILVGITQWDYSQWPIEEDRTDTSDEDSFATSGEISISGINPTEGAPGTVVTITGENFGSGTSIHERRVSVGCELGTWSNDPLPNTTCTTGGDILSWSDTEITFRLSERATTGSVWIGKGNRWEQGVLGRQYILWTAEGPDFTVSETEDEDEEDGNTFADPRGNVYLNSAYGCSFSTEFMDESTIKVPQLFADGSDTDTYLEQVYNSYQDAWGRYPRCTELQFHLDHATPMERLETWLEENIPEEITSEEAIPQTSDDIEGAKIVFEDAGENVVLADASQDLRFGEDEVITFTGRTEPNALVTLTIASESPMVVTTHSNAEGYWQYALPGPLALGEHTVTVSVVDLDGALVSESSPIAFTVESGSSSSATQQIIETLEEYGFTTTTWMIIVLAAVVIFVLVSMLNRAKAQASDSDNAGKQQPPKTRPPKEQEKEEPKKEEE